MENVENHKLLLDREVTNAEIYEARTARKRALEEYEHNETRKEEQRFGDCRASLSPLSYDTELVKITRDRCKDTCGWLEDEDEFQRWISGRRKTTTFLWLSGIPGAGQYSVKPACSATIPLIPTGKSYLSTSFIARARNSGRTILFALLSFQPQEATTVVTVLHSLIFQLLYKHQFLRPAITKAYEKDYTELQSYVEYNQQLFTDLLQCIEAPCIVIDGLDEIPEKERQLLLKSLLKIADNCSERKILISSRQEQDISRALNLKALSLQIGLKNSEDIRKYFDYTVRDWLDSLDINDRTNFELENLLQSIPGKAEGETAHRECSAAC